MITDGDEGNNYHDSNGDRNNNINHENDNNG